MGVFLAELLLLYYCITTALLLLYYCFTPALLPGHRVGRQGRQPPLAARQHHRMALGARGALPRCMRQGDAREASY